MIRACARGLIAGLLAAAAAAAAAEEQLVDAIAAQVGSRVVLVSEVMRLAGPQEAALRAAGAPESQIAVLRASALEQLIESRLIEELVQQAELYASDEEVDRTIESIARENGLTLEQLKASVAFHGMSFEEYRSQIKRDLERRNVVNAAVGSKVNVDEAEVRRLYERRFAAQPQGGTSVHVRQLLIASGDASRRDQASACALAETASRRIRSGEDFAAVAREMSEVAPQDGGDIGWLHLDSVAPWMREALAPLELGQTSGVVSLPFGCTLLNLVERREFTPVSYEQASDRLRQELWEQQMDAAYRQWIGERRAKTYIDRRGYFADAAQLGGASRGAGPDSEPSFQ